MQSLGKKDFWSIMISFKSCFINLVIYSTKIIFSIKNGNKRGFISILNRDKSYFSLLQIE